MRFNIDLNITRLTNTDYTFDGTETGEFTITDIDGTFVLDATIVGPFIDPASGLPNETYLTVVGPTVKAALKAFVKRVADVRIAEEFDYLDNNGRTEEEAVGERSAV